MAALRACFIFWSVPRLQNRLSFSSCYEIPWGRRNWESRLRFLFRPFFCEDSDVKKCNVALPLCFVSFPFENRHRESSVHLGGNERSKGNHLTCPQGLKEASKIYIYTYRAAQVIDSLTIPSTY